MIPKLGNENKSQVNQSPSNKERDEFHKPLAAGSMAKFRPPKVKETSVVVLHEMANVEP